MVSGGEVLSILSGEVPAAVLTEPAEVEGALSAYYVSLGHSPEAFDSFLSLHDDVAAIRNNRKAGEAKCRILTGTDRHECTTFEGCQQACYSVTSFCLPVALGSGREFIEIIWAFENNTRALDAASENEDRRFAALSSARDGDSSLAYLSALFEVNRAATAASESPLYDGYSYCFQPDYSLPKITVAYLRAKDYLDSFLPFFQLPKRAEEVRQNALSALQRKQEYGLSLALNASLQAQNGTGNGTAAGPEQLQDGNVSTPEQESVSSSGEGQVPQPSPGIPFEILAGAALLACAAAAAFLARGKGRRRS